MTQPVQKTKQAPSLRRGFLAASLAYMLIFAASALPITLYSEYKLTIGLTDADVSTAMVFYLVGVLGILFFAGRISDAIGRRTTTALGCALAVLCSVVFAGTSSVPMLYFGRFIQGLSCGVAMSAVSAWVVDCSKGKLAVIGTTIAGCGALIGITLGTLALAGIRSITPDYNVSYWAVSLALGAALALLPLAPETVQDRTPLAQALKPSFGVPAPYRNVFLVAVASYSTAWSVGAFYQSYCSLIAIDYLHNAAPLMSSLILAGSMAPSAIGGPIEARFPSGFSLRLALAILLASAFGTLITMIAGLSLPFLALVMLFSISVGMCLSGSLRLMFSQTDGMSTATITSTINLVAYIVCTVCSFISSILAEAAGLTGILAFLIMVSFAATAFVFLRTRRQRTVSRGMQR